MSASPPPTVSWQSPESQAGPAPGVEFAPHGGRLVAYIIDSIIISIVLVIIFTIGAFALGSGATIEGNQVTEISSGSAIIATILFLVGFLVGLLYFPFFWARGGQTPGMRPFGLRVVRDSDGGAIGWGTALLRLVGPGHRGGRVLPRLHLDLHRQAPAWLAGPHRRDDRRQAALSGPSRAAHR